MPTVVHLLEMLDGGIPSGNSLGLKGLQMSMVERPLAGLAAATAQPAAPVPLDDVDLALLELLGNDARMSQRGLARELGMSPPAIGERIARLERTGVICGYSVLVDWGALGYPVIVYLAVSAVPGSDQGAVIESLRELPEVEDITVVTGAIDMLARVRVRDYAHLRELLLERVWQIGGVQRTETMLGIAATPRKNFVSELVDSLRASDDAVAPGGTAT